LLCELSEEKAFTLCVSLHNLELAREFFPRLIGLRHGKIAFDGRPDSIDEVQLGSLFELSAEELMEES
jgi:phosphonate transport system ATP-binding protein